MAMVWGGGRREVCLDVDVPLDTGFEGLGVDS